MAIYVCRINTISRGKGRSAVAAATYRSGEKLHCEYTGETPDYTGKHYVEKKEILLPASAPQAWLDRETLWNAVENAEKSRDGKLATEIMAAIPAELDKEQRQELIRAFCEELCRKGFIVDYAIHNPPLRDDLNRPIDEDGHPTGDPSKMQFINPHVHIMLPIRPLDENGSFVKSKSESEYYCKDPESGTIRKLTSAELKESTIDWQKLFPCRIDGKTAYLTLSEIEEKGLKRESPYPLKSRYGRPSREYAYRMSPDFVNDIRKIWEAYANAALEKAGRAERIDHRSYREQGTDKVSMIHFTPQVTKMLKKEKRLTLEGKDVRDTLKSDYAELNREIRRHNHLADVYAAEEKEAEKLEDSAESYAKQLAAARGRWVSEKCHVKQLEDIIREMSPKKESLEERMAQFKESLRQLEEAGTEHRARLEDLDAAVESGAKFSLLKKSRLQKEKTEELEEIRKCGESIRELKAAYGYEMPEKLEADERLLVETAIRLKEAEETLKQSRHNEKACHDRYFEIRKTVPVIIRKKVTAMENRHFKSSAGDIADAFGQLAASVTELVETEIQVVEYQEKESRTY